MVRSLGITYFLNSGNITEQGEMHVKCNRYKMLALTYLLNTTVDNKNNGETSKNIFNKKKTEE